MSEVLLINGSPNERGCTYTALHEVEKSLNKNGVETEILYLGKGPVQGCTGCRACGKTGKCAFDDGVNRLIERLEEFDGLVVGSPVYFASPNGTLLAFLDRLFFAAGNKFAGKAAAAVVSCRRGGATAAFDVLNKYFTICNMAIEAGAKNGIFPVDDVTLAYMNGRCERAPVIYTADPDAVYEQTIEIDLSRIVPTVACPHLPENTRPASELHDIKIDQVVIGSCTNGRMEDMEAAYHALNGKTVAPGVRCIIIPATMAVYRECIQRGYVTAFIDAGAIVSTPTCGPCLGGYMGILAAGERCIATTNRNFVGRMGHVKSEVYLASPATAAASALTGYITEPKEAGK